MLYAADRPSYGELSTALVELRRQDARALADAGHSLREIAEALGVSHQTVANDLRATTISGQLDDAIAEQAFANHIDPDADAQDMDARIRDIAGRGHDDNQQPVQPATPAPAPPTAAQQMDNWLRSPAARRHGVTLNGPYTEMDRAIHDQYRTSAAARSCAWKDRINSEIEKEQ